MAQKLKALAINLNDPCLIPRKSHGERREDSTRFPPTSDFHVCTGAHMHLPTAK